MPLKPRVLLLSACLMFSLIVSIASSLFARGQTLPLPTPANSGAAFDHQKLPALTLILPAGDISTLPTFQWTPHRKALRYKIVVKVGDRRKLAETLAVEEICTASLCTFDSASSAGFERFKVDKAYTWFVIAITEHRRIKSESIPFMLRETRTICSGPDTAQATCIAPPATTRPPSTAARTNTPVPPPPPTSGSSSVSRIGYREPLPIITDLKGGCRSSSKADRPGCAIQTYLAASRQYGDGTRNGQRVLNWDQFIGMTIVGEASIFYIDPTASVNAKWDLQCIRNSKPDCIKFRQIFEKAVMRQIYEACGGVTCTEANFVKLMAGPPANQWGNQAWYQAARTDGSVNLAPLIHGNDLHYKDDLEDNALHLLSDNALIGCNGNACSWGNPKQKPPPPTDYASHKNIGNATYGVFDGRVYFIVGRP